MKKKKKKSKTKKAPSEITIDKTALQKKIEEVYTYVKEGMKSDEIYSMLLIRDASLSPERFKKILNEAYVYAEKSLNKDREYIFQLHMDRYEDIFTKSTDLTSGARGHVLNPNNPMDWPIIVGRYKQAMDALKSKEELLGLHNRKFVFEFNEEKAVVIGQSSDRGRDGGVLGYKFDNLTMEEQIELLELIKEARLTPLDGIQKVVIKQRKIEISIESGGRSEKEITKEITDIQDVTFEEMPNDVVSKFKNIEKKEEPVIPTGTIVIDNRPKVEPKTGGEITDKLKKNVMEEWKERIRKAKEK